MLPSSNIFFKYCIVEIRSVINIKSNFLSSEIIMHPSIALKGLIIALTEGTKKQSYYEKIHNVRFCSKIYYYREK